jgi:hypothetical protein
MQCMSESSGPESASGPFKQRMDLMPQYNKQRLGLTLVLSHNIQGITIKDEGLCLRIQNVVPKV